MAGLVVLHKSVGGAELCVGAESIPGPGQVVHPLQADPEGLSAGLAFRTLDIATQTGDQMDEILKPRRFFRRLPGLPIVFTKAWVR